MMRFGIPKYRLPRDVLDAEVQRILDLGVKLELNAKGRAHRGDDEGGSASTPRSSPSARTSASAPSFPRARRRGSWMPSRCCATWRAKRSRCSAGAWWSTAAATPRSTWRAPPSGLGATDAIIVYRRTREKMPAHESELQEALEEGVLIKWLSTIKSVAGRGHAHGREDEARREGLSRSPPARPRRWKPTRWCWRSARTWTWACWKASPGLEIRDGVVQVGPNMMTGRAGLFRRRGHGSPRSGR
jgi:hypothetical protein